MSSSRKKNSFLVYYDNKVIVLRLPDDEAGKLFKSLFEYGEEGTVPEFECSPALAMAFDIFKMAIDRDAIKYQNKCEKNRENGRKGGIAKSTNRYQSQANPIEYSERLANLADMDRDMDNDIDSDKERDMDNDIDSDKERDRINYQQIADMYNDTCVSFPKVTKLSESRKKAIKARLKQYTLDDFKRLFEMAESSDFLKGKNERNWSASFDWLIKDSNMAKVLDGNYKNKGDSGQSEKPRIMQAHEDPVMMHWAEILKDQGPVDGPFK